MNPTLLLLILPLLLPAAPPRHPHFHRKVEITLARKAGTAPLVMSVEHLTATFDREGFAKTAPGGTWHLANAHVELSAPVTIGGKEVAAGRHRLVARKKEDGSWELVLDRPGRFSSRLGEAAIPLQTEFVSGKERKEHLGIDVAPSGEKGRTVIHLVVAFDAYRARARVEVP